MIKDELQYEEVSAQQADKRSQVEVWTDLNLTLTGRNNEFDYR